MIVKQKNHWAKEVIIKIAKSNTRCSEIPEFQPEQVERVLQITGSVMGRFGKSLLWFCPAGLLFFLSAGQKWLRRGPQLLL